MEETEVIIQHLIEAARSGDRECKEAMISLLPSSPKAALEVGGGLARVAERASLTAIGLLDDGDTPVRDIANAEITVLRAELEGKAPSALERLLVSRVICSWLSVNGAEWEYANITRGRSDLQREEFYDRRLARAQRRFLAACKALAQVRKLLGPSFQVNVAARP